VTDLEVVICDNASTDRSFEICTRIAQEDKRVRLFRNESNIGPLNNWIRCSKEANGIYGKLLFSDDLMYVDYLATTIQFMKSEDVGAVFSAVEYGTQAGCAEVWYAWTRDAGVVASSEFVHDALFLGNVPYSPGAYLFRLADIRRFLVAFPSYKVGEQYASQGMGPDLGLCLLTASAYQYIAHVPKPLGLFRKHDGSFTESSLKQTRLWNYNRVRKAIIDQTGDKKQMRRWIAWSWLTSMAASGRAMSLSTYFKFIDIEKGDFRPRFQDLFWGGTFGMWPAFVRYCRRFRALRQVGLRNSVPMHPSRNEVQKRDEVSGIVSS
jgi:hypothetical protein